MDKKSVIAEVEAFREKTAFGNKQEDCFPAWYLRHELGVSETQAQNQSAEPGKEGTPGYDFGLDAYHLILSGNKSPRLVLIQAKYSDNLNYIKKGFKDLERAIPKISDVLSLRSSQDLIENRILVNLRKDLNRLKDNVRNELSLEFLVIHLCTQEEVIVLSNTRQARDSLKESIEELLTDRAHKISDIGPLQMGEMPPPPPPPDWVQLTLNTVSLDATKDQKPVKMYYGVGQLAELAELYRQRRDDLFAKNVRYFIKSKRNIETGPSGKMRETLKQICLRSDQERLEPEVFAFFHNGITIFARDAELTSTGIRVREPYVLNGCQTIKTSFYFRYDAKIKERIDEERWQRISVPLRIVTTRDDELIRQITVNNNRQNAISRAALRANEPIQIRLEERFRKVGIFYQRQEGAYANLLDSNPEILEDDYANSRGQYVEIVDLARSLAAISGKIDWANHPGVIFEEDKAYNDCFSDKHLASIIFLTFLQNLHDVIALVLKMDLGLAQNGYGPRPSRLSYYVLCLLVRYLAREEKLDFVMEFGQTLWGRHWQFREKVGHMLDNYHSRIKWAIQEIFLKLEDGSTESIKDAFKRSEASLNLGNDIAVFDIFRRLQ